MTVGQRPETMEVIREVCREKGADLTETDLSSAKAVKEDFAGQTLEYLLACMYLVFCNIFADFHSFFKKP